MASPIIFCDMDGVLADFKTAAVRVNGMSIQKWMNIPSSREKWERIKNTSNFWHNLPWMAGGQALWRYLTKFDPHILSAYVEETYDPNCIPGKTAWLRKNTRITDKSKIHLVRRKEKKNFAKYGGQKNILIDDYEKNVREFINAGGMGIVHKDYRNTIRSLKLLGIQ